MQGMIPVKEYTSAAEMRAASNANHKRLMGNPVREQPAPDPAPSVRLVFIRDMDAHVHAWTRHLAAKVAKYETKTIPALQEKNAPVGVLRQHVRRQAEMIERMTKEAESPDTGPKVRAHEVIKRMSRASGYTYGQIVGGAMSRHLCRVRHLTAYQIHIECSHLPIARIGAVMGGRDHSTITNSIKRARKILAEETDGECDAKILAASERLRALGGQPSRPERMAQ